MVMVMVSSLGMVLKIELEAEMEMEMEIKMMTIVSGFDQCCSYAEPLSYQWSRAIQKGQVLLGVWFDGVLRLRINISALPYISIAECENAPRRLCAPGGRAEGSGLTAVAPIGVIS